MVRSIVVSKFSICVGYCITAEYISYRVIISQKVDSLRNCDARFWILYSVLGLNGREERIASVSFV